MSCMLRVGGDSLDLDSLLESTSLVPNNTWRKGDYRIKDSPKRGVCDTSGASFIVSDADFDAFETQKEDAITFLIANANSLHTLLSFSGVDGSSLDFGVDWSDPYVVQSYSFPAKLISLAGELHLELEISVYVRGEEE